MIALGIGPEISQSIKDIYSAANVWSFDRVLHACGLSNV
jgi:hypothetical protein